MADANSPDVATKIAERLAFDGLLLADIVQPTAANLIRDFLAPYEELVKAATEARQLLTVEYFDTSEGLIARCAEVGSRLRAALDALKGEQ